MPGQTVVQSNGEAVFLRGQMVETKEGPAFLHGDVMVNNKNQVQFLPGQLVQNQEREKAEFIPGLLGETEDGIRFIEGRLIKRGQRRNKIANSTDRLNLFLINIIRQEMRVCSYLVQPLCMRMGWATGLTRRWTARGWRCSAAPATPCWSTATTST